MRRTFLLVLLALLGTHLGPAIAGEKDVGIVLMHGKWDRPPTNVLGLARQLEAQGFLVATPTMPWAGIREYDVPYAKALDEITAAVQELKAKGAKTIVIGGQSFGANAALAYAGSGRPLDAMFLLSPGHTPYTGRMKAALEGSVKKAAEMVKSGAGAERAWFGDMNQGQAKQVRATADAYWSYFDPEGLADMPRMAAATTTAIPVFLAVGASDPMSAQAEQTIFSRLPKHPASVYTVPAADHMGILGVIQPALLAWLKTVAP